MLTFNPDYALERLLRAKNTANHRFCQLIFCNHSGALLSESKLLIYGVFDPHDQI